MEGKKQCSKSWDGVRCTNQAKPGISLCQECEIKVMIWAARIAAQRQEDTAEGSWPVEKQVAF